MSGCRWPAKSSPIASTELAFNATNMWVRAGGGGEVGGGVLLDFGTTGWLPLFPPPRKEAKVMGSPLCMHRPFCALCCPVHAPQAAWLPSPESCFTRAGMRCHRMQLP